MPTMRTTAAEAADQGAADQGRPLTRAAADQGRPLTRAAADQGNSQLGCRLVCSFAVFAY